jgi:hypothetical protein
MREVENADHQAIFASRTSAGGLCDNQIKGSDCPIESHLFLCYFPDSTPAACRN